MSTTPDTPLHDPLKSLTAAIERRHQRFLSDIARCPKTKSCHQHPDTIAEFDHDRTILNGAITYRCADCDRAAEEAQFVKIQNNCGVPYDVRHATFENFDYHRKPDHVDSCTPSDFLRAATSFTAGTFRNLILSGTCGIGKGHLGAAVINAAIAQKRVRPQGQLTAKWVTAHNLFSACHELYKTTGIEPLLHHYASRNLLVLDECAMAEMPRDGQRIFYEIIDRRQKQTDRVMLTLFLTNATVPALKQWLGAPAVDRLRSGGVKALWGSWPSARGTDIDRAGKAGEF